MEGVDKVYGKSFFSRRYKLHWRAPVVCEAFNRVFNPTSIVDLGCATGDLVRYWLDQGKDAFGIEGSPAAEPFIVIPPGHYLIHDLRVPHKLDTRYDLVTSLEVAEHIEPAYADAYLDNLVGLAKDCICISAAPPGQGGHGHVNCQPQSYWIRKLRERMFKYSLGYTTDLRKQLAPWAHKDGVRAFYHNLIVFWRIR
jgi:hypothetical protein